MIPYDTYLLPLGFPPVAVIITLVHKMQRTVIYTRRNNTDHRTQKIESTTYKAIKKIKQKIAN
jgi:hypothetical protein